MREGKKDELMFKLSTTNYQDSHILHTHATDIQSHVHTLAIHIHHQRPLSYLAPSTYIHTNTYTYKYTIITLCPTSSTDGMCSFGASKSFALSKLSIFFFSWLPPSISMPGGSFEPKIPCFQLGQTMHTPRVPGEYRGYVCGRA
mmetsp:Transcript_30469/g.78976  ORF Transcript_30469/g.78976 Transcript_30469/m.78976 type:complete len:144 (-) Transcript_30469:1880-2311(-)